MMMLEFLIVPLVLIVALALLSQRGGLRLPQGETPLEVLRRRYAGGEISKDEFEQARRDLA